MRRIKQIKTLTILFFAITIAFMGCNDDDLQNHNHNHQSNFSAKKLSPEEALQIARKLNGLVNNGKHNTLLISEQSVSVANNSVDFSTVNLIESINGTKTYAFAVNDTNLEDNIIKNVILQEFQNEIVVKEVSYNMTDSFKQQYYNGATDFKSFQGTLTFETVFGNPCPDDADPVSIGIPINGGGSNSSGTGGGTGGGGSSGSGNTGGSFGGGFGGSYGSGGSGGGGGGYAYFQCENCSRTYGSRSEMDGSICAGYNYIIVISFGQNENVVPNNSPCDPSTTLPIAEQEFFFKARDFQRSLTPEQRTWTQQNPTAYNQILTYLRNENWSNESEAFAMELIDFSLNNQTYASNLFNNLNSENWSNESIQFTNYVIEVLEANPNANPLIGADCRSFEFAQPPGATKKGCPVTNFNHTFYTAGIFPNGSPYFGEIDSTVPIAYFTMPTWMTNGRAANLTAKAVTFAIKATDLYYAANPTVSEVVLGQYFSNRLSHFLNAVGGTVSTSTPPFSIPSPAPYIISLIGVSNPYNCE
jgi:hypothetical protein